MDEDDGRGLARALGQVAELKERKRKRWRARWRERESEAVGRSKKVENEQRKRVERGRPSVFSSHSIGRYLFARDPLLCLAFNLQPVTAKLLLTIAPLIIS